MNIIIATGRLTANCELAYTTNGKSRQHFTLAVLDNDKEGKYPTLFLDCYMFGKEKLVNYLVKGKAITIQGRLISFEYIDKYGVQQKKIQVIINELEFVPTEKQKIEPLSSQQGQGGVVIYPEQKQAEIKPISKEDTRGTYTDAGFKPDYPANPTPDDFDNEEVPF